MSEQPWVTEQFEAQRPHLRSVAYRMLGSATEAEDAVQEAWIRLDRAGADGVENLGGWLTTVVARVCLDMLRSRKSRREDPLEAHAPAGEAGGPSGNGTPAEPEHEALLGDSIGLALLVVLETLTPAERVAFVLHDTFAVPFEEIAPIVGRSPEATRQLASRARRRVRGTATVPNPDPERQRQVVTAFLAAAHGGDFEALVALLDPDIVLRSDEAAVFIGSPEEVLGATAVAGMFSGRALGARAALLDGVAGLVWAPGGTPKVVFAFTVDGDRVVSIDMVADPERLDGFDIDYIDAGDTGTSGP